PDIAASFETDSNLPAAEVIQRNRRRAGTC
ncbi:MAG: hypothetical protein ACI8T1_004503, partial [Verrucomicrobiales bacterium]